MRTFPVLSLVISLVAMTAFAATPDPDAAIKAQALKILGTQDSMKAIEYIALVDDPLLAMDVFSSLSRDLYWENRNLAAALAIGRAGVQYGIVAANRVGGEAAGELHSQSKALAYDISSFCWPGWDEAGIEIDDTELVLGQDLAKTNLRLAITLNKGNLPLSRAYWLVGAHHLAGRQYEAARRAFVLAVQFAIAAEARDQEVMLRGYIYLSDLLIDPGNSALLTEFDFVLQELDTSREGAKYSAQLQTARAVFMETPTP